MEPINVDVVTADQVTLRTECTRLGLRVSATASVPQLRIALHQYSQRYKQWVSERDERSRVRDMWCGIARLLELSLPADVTPEGALQGVCDHLYGLLVEAGYVGPGRGGRRKRLRHKADDEPFYVTGQLEGDG